MNNKEKQVNNLINLKSELKDFIYPDFPDLKIYSSEYYHNIFLSLFNDASEKFAYIYFDFNKMNTVNQLYGKETGDKALRNSLQVIKQSLPSNALFSRIGGDEFAIILPGMDKSDGELIKKNINKNLKQYSNFIFGLSVTASVTDSNKGTISKLEHLTEQSVTRKKQNNKTNTKILRFPDLNELPFEIPQNISEKEHKSWEILNALIDKSISNHLTDIRPSDKFKYNSEDLKQELLHTISIFSSLLKKSTETNIDFQNNNKKRENSTKKSSSYVPNNKKINKLVHNFLLDNTSSELNYIDLPNLEEMKTFMSKLLDTLIIHKGSSMFNKHYLDLYLLNKLCTNDKNYQAAYFSAAGIKPSNTAYGHLFTNKKIYHTANLLKSEITKHFTCNNTPFTYSEKDVFLIDQGGGNFLCLLPEGNTMTQEQFSNIIENVNSNYNSNSQDSPFMISGHMQNNILKSTPQSLKKSIRILKEQCNEDKDFIKKISISSITQKLAFENSIKHCIDFYLSDIPNAKTDITKKQYFIKNVFTSLLNNQSLHNEISKNTLDLNNPNIDTEDLEK